MVVSDDVTGVDPLFAARVKLDVRRRLFGGAALPLLVGRFEVIRRIGQGGMSIVYAARDPELGRTVALKLLQEGGGHERLIREARALALLRHPNVVAVYDVGTFQDRLFLAMEHVEGVTLTEWLAAEPRSWREIVRVLHDAGAGLAAAHDVGLVHRDVKPDNILVDAAGQARVVDFGLVTDATSDVVKEQAHVGPEQPTSLTQPGATPGTPLYMAPERFLGEPGSASSDQYSYCVTLHEALYGAPPFAATDVAALRRLVLSGDPPDAPPDRGVPPHLWRAVARGLSRLPADRFPTMRALLSSLEQQPSTFRQRAIGAVVLTGLAAAALLAWSASASRATSSPVASTNRAADASTANGEPAIYQELVSGTSSDEARANMLAGMLAFRGGDRGALLFEKAATQDPLYGAPHLWIAVLQSHGDLIASRAAFEKAFARRATMSAASQTMLDALVPCIQSDPPDATECQTRLSVAANARPDNAHLWFELARVRWNAEGSSNAVVEAFDRALAADPGFVLPRFTKGQALAYLGRFDEALATVDECLRLAPGATPCLHDRIWINAQRNECRAVEADARKWQAATPSDFFPYVYLASTAIARGDSLTAVAELLRQSVERAPESQRAFFAARDHALLSLLGGDFVSAQRDVEAVAAALDHVPDQASRLIPPRLRIMIALETGDKREAGRLAEEALATKGAWIPDPRVEDFAIARDFAPELFDVLRDTGTITPAKGRELRDEWLRSWQAKTAPANAPFLWLAGYARGVSDEEEAREASEAMPRYGNPPFHPLAYPDPGIGRMYLLTSHPAEALPFLRRAAEGCHGVEFTFGVELPWGSTRASLDLGRALEQTGDPKGACVAYRRVLDRWGRAIPKSVTADAARVRWRALGCLDR